jgi:Undecaprenyl-phosphate galactose phosphotransferase WbaP
MFPIRQMERPEYLTSGARTHTRSAPAGCPRRVLAERICPPILVASDILASIPAIIAAFSVHVSTQPSPHWRSIVNLTQVAAAGHGWGSVLVLLGLIGFFGGRGHYTSRVPFWTQLRGVVMATAAALACDTFLIVAVYDQSVHPEGLLRWVFYCPFLLLFRAGIRESLGAIGLWSINTFVVADCDVAEQARAALLSDPALGYVLVGSMGLTDAASLDDDAFVDLLDERHADFVVVTVGSGRSDAERAVICALRRANRPFALVPAIEGLPVVGLRQHHFFSHDFTMLVSRNTFARPFARLFKALFDQLAAVLLLLLLAPLLLVFSALVCSDGGPVFCRHPRIGVGGRVFHCLKFRTMVVDAGRVFNHLLATDPAAVAEWAARGKLCDDPRVTGVGRFLRRSGLDELPQLFNVLCGEMSLVGPRPIVRAEVERYRDEIEYYYEAKPGLTGLWQVSGRSDTSYERKVRLDIWYVRNWTLWHDITILLKTISAVFLQRGAP